MHKILEKIHMKKFYQGYPVFSSLVGGSSSLSQKQRRKAIHDRRKAKAQEEQQLREAIHKRRREKSRLVTETGGPVVEENPCAFNNDMGPIKVNDQCDGKEDPLTYEIIPVGRGVCSGKHCYSINTLRRIAREGDNRDPQTNK